MGAKKEISILFEDAELLVIDKPAGVLVHPNTGDSTEWTVATWVQEQYPELATVGEPLTLRDGTTIDRPGIVHRIDRDTSGVLLIAKTQDMFLHLKRQFQEGRVQKTYNAFTYGIPNPKVGSIERAIGRSSKDFRLKSAQRGARGKLRDARTDYEVIKHDGIYAFLHVFPKTGRTHQIRVHLKAINHPIVCDPLYAPNQGCALGFTRLALHARAISIQNKVGEEQTFEAPLPADFQAAATKFADV